jgi:hypothetical protein
MSTAIASVPVSYSYSEGHAINPWIIAVTVTLATFTRHGHCQRSPAPYCRRAGR